MNGHSKHIVCFISSEISMYLTKIPELSANCMRGECLYDCQPMGCNILFFPTLKHFNTKSS